MEKFSEKCLDKEKNKTKQMKALAGVVLLILGISLYGMVWQFLLRDHPPMVQIGNEAISLGLPVQKVVARGYLLYNSENQLVDPEDWTLPANTAIKEQFNLRLTGEAKETSVSIRLYNAAKEEQKLAQCIIYEIDCLCDQERAEANQSVAEVRIDGTNYQEMSAEEAIVMMSGEVVLRMDEQAYKADPSRCSFIGNGYQYDLYFDQHGVKLKEIQVSKQMDFIDEGGQ